jgi:hypothetical protein
MRSATKLKSFQGEKIAAFHLCGNRTKEESIPATSGSYKTL